MNATQRIILGALVVSAVPLGAACEMRRPDAVEPAATSQPLENFAGPVLPADTNYAALLKAIVDVEGMVQYQLLDEAHHAEQLRRALEFIASAELPEHHANRLALYCNGYNANALHLAWQASADQGFKTVLDEPGFFDSKSFLIAGRSFTLNALMDEIRAFGDPRIHGALVFGARDCPPLRAEPYAGHMLEAQLDDQCRRWLTSQRAAYANQRQLLLNEIFRRHSDDFRVEPYGDHIQFIFKFSRPAGIVRGYIRGGEQISRDWQTFDWRLNQSQPLPTKNDS